MDLSSFPQTYSSAPSFSGGMSPLLLVLLLLLFLLLNQSYQKISITLTLTLSGGFFFLRLSSFFFLAVGMMFSYLCSLFQSAPHVPSVRLTSQDTAPNVSFLCPQNLSGSCLSVSVNVNLCLLHSAAPPPNRLLFFYPSCTLVVRLRCLLMATYSLSLASVCGFLSSSLSSWPKLSYPARLICPEVTSAFSGAPYCFMYSVHGICHFPLYTINNCLPLISLLLRVPNSLKTVAVSY